MHIVIISLAIRFRGNKKEAFAWQAELVYQSIHSVSLS